ncbi:hypothetical protein [Streptomyces sp. NPDC057686]|uniref:hypothetical protein n=1 Tax=Streptomyces sp. NPDC057686 TaxID=3346212 RepID=UPI00368F1EB1
MYGNIPDSFAAGGIDAAYTPKTGHYGLIKGNLVHHTDWGPNVTKTLAEMYPSLPDSFRSGVDAAYAHPLGTYGLIKGGQVHHTDWLNNATKNVEEVYPNIPAAWQ